jgi:lipoprotein-anchoring transpeptidase ErfK/SrfK
MAINEEFGKLAPPERNGSWQKWLWLVIIVVAVGFAGTIIYQKVFEYIDKKRQKEAAVQAQLAAQVAESNKWVELEKFVADEPVKARERCYELLDKWTNGADRARLEGILGKLNTDLLFSPHAMAEKVEYTVQSGDSLDKIARKFNTTIEVIQRGNAIRGATIHAGDRLRVPQGVFTLHISKSRNELEVRLNDKFFKRYRVGTGKFGKTPVGTFFVNDRIINPVWWRPDGKMIPFGDKENLLGTRWLALTAAEGTEPVKGYGIHGTWEPDTVGTQASMGCIRLVNSDVEELFQFVPVGCKVFITE